MNIKVLSQYLVFIFIILFSTSAYSNDFRKYSWGISKQQVKSTEKAKFISDVSDNNTLVFIKKVLDEECYIIYNFRKNKLIRGQYFWNGIKYQNAATTLYDTLNRELSSKYELITKNSLGKVNYIYQSKRSYIVLEMTYITEDKAYSVSIVYADLNEVDKKGEDSF